MDSKQYTYRVKWSAEDNGYVGACKLFCVSSIVNGILKLTPFTLQMAK